VTSGTLLSNPIARFSLRSLKLSPLSNAQGADDIHPACVIT
jgi:hypothetical protein